MKTLMMILVSLGVGVGSTLLVQTVIVTPPPVVAVVACPDRFTITNAPHASAMTAAAVPKATLVVLRSLRTRARRSSSIESKRFSGAERRAWRRACARGLGTRLDVRGMTTTPLLTARANNANVSPKNGR